MMHEGTIDNGTLVPKSLCINDSKGRWWTFASRWETGLLLSRADESEGTGKL
jgi:hypothetical protein